MSCEKEKIYIADISFDKKMFLSSKNYAPFGSNVNKFGKITVHPNLDPSGLYTERPNGCDPCLYSPRPIETICRNINNKKTKDPWTYKRELEDWSKNLGYRNQTILDQNKWFKSILGPAWHEIKDAAWQYEAECKNITFGRTPRFKHPKNKLPGPGTYYKMISPKSLEPNTKSTLKREETCRFKDKSLKWSLAPNRYSIIDKDSIENKMKKIVSIRGPYDLFTGKRDESSIKNHFNRSLKCSSVTWPLMLKSTLEKYKNSHFGKMNKTSRAVPYMGRNALVDLSMVIRKSEDPGQTQYNIDKQKCFRNNKYGFNSSYDRPPGYSRVIVWPAVGRYDIKDTRRSITGHGHLHVMLSKEKRTIGAKLPQSMNTF